MADEILKTLRTAAKGLLYPSESDKPVKALHWTDFPAGTVDEKSVAAYLKVEKVTQKLLEDFFGPVVNLPKEAGDAERGSGTQFAALHDTLTKIASDAAFFRVERDETTADAYVLGRAVDGTVAGIQTQLVET